MRRDAAQSGLVALGCLVVFLCALGFFIYLNHRAEELAQAPPEPAPATEQKKSPAEP